MSIFFFAFYYWLPSFDTIILTLEILFCWAFLLKRRALKIMKLCHAGDKKTNLLMKCYNNTLKPKMLLNLCLLTPNCKYLWYCRMDFKLFNIILKVIQYYINPFWAFFSKIIGLGTIYNCFYCEIICIYEMPNC